MTPKGYINKVQMKLEEFLPFEQDYIYLALDSTVGIKVTLRVTFMRKKEKKSKQYSDEEQGKSCLPNLDNYQASQELVHLNRRTVSIWPAV